MNTNFRFKVVDENNTKISSFAFGSIFENPSFVEELEYTLQCNLHRPLNECESILYRFIKKYTSKFYNSKKCVLKSYSNGWCKIKECVLSKNESDKKPNTDNTCSYELKLCVTNLN